MSDNQFADLMHTAFDPLIEDTPELPAWEAIQLERPGPIPTTGPRWWAGVAAAAVVLFLGAVMVVGTRLGLPDAATSLASPAALADLSRGELGPEPQFDTASLGEELVLEYTDPEVLADEGALPEILGPDSARITRDVLSGYNTVGDPVYMGHSNGFHGLIVHYINGTGEEQFCLIVAQVVPQTRSGVTHGCYDPLSYSDDAPRLHIGATIPEPPSTELPEIHVSSLAEDVSVVALELLTGESYWQRPTSGAVLIVPEQGKPWLGYTITTYDAAGNVLDTAVLHDSTSADPVPAAIPSEQDVVVIFDAAAAGFDPALLDTAVAQAESVPGVIEVAVISVQDIGEFLNWTHVPGPGLVISTLGNDAVAEQVVALLADVPTAPVNMVLFSLAVGEARVKRAVELLARDAVPLSDGLMAVAQSGPEPEFDTAALGEEMVLEPADDAEVLGELASLAPRMAEEVDPTVLEELVGPSYYLGHVGQVHGIMAPFRHDGELVLCDIGTIETSAVAMSCDNMRDAFHVEDGEVRGQIGFGASSPSDPSEPASITLRGLSDQVSVVAIELTDGGDRYWQRPVGGAALFVMPGRENISFTVTAFDSAGNILVTDKHMF